MKNGVGIKFHTSFTIYELIGQWLCQLIGLERSASQIALFSHHKFHNNYHPSNIIKNTRVGQSALITLQSTTEDSRSEGRGFKLEVMLHKFALLVTPGRQSQLNQVGYSSIGNEKRV